MKERYIDLDGTYNFRDIGGYKTKDGRTVKMGIHFRSDQLCDLLETDVNKLQEMGLKTIIDYRNDQEREEFKNVEIPNTKTYCLNPVANIAALASSEEVEEELSLADMTAEHAKWLMTQQNEEFVKGESSQRAYREMFKIMLEEENHAIVQHCRGGKDRTGYGVALIHLLLGVSKDDIIHDYMLTNKYKLEKNEKSIYETYKETKNAELTRAVRYFKEAQESFIYKALDLIEEDFGGINNYVKNVLCLTDSEIEKIKSIYLE